MHILILEAKLHYTWVNTDYPTRGFHVYPGTQESIYIQDLPAAIADRGVWCGVVKSISAEAAR